ncbi:lipopolysaccharide biosynthesis protein [Blastococcus sp. SYSU D01042]
MTAVQPEVVPHPAHPVTVEAVRAEMATRAEEAAPAEEAAVSTRQMSLGYLRRHAWPLISVGGLSVLGIASTSGFHVVTGRGLGPGGFGLLAAFLAIVNIASIGASALQNSVAVVTAAALAAGPREAPRRRMDGATVEALVLGGGFAGAVVLASPLFADALNTSRLAVNLAALTIVPSFLFCVALGRLQATGRAWILTAYSTAAQILRLLLAIAALAVGLGAVSIVLGVLVAIVAVAALASWQTRGLRVSGTRAFSRRSTKLMLITLSFAWLTNIDVLLVRIYTVDDVSGGFAAAALLAKMGLLVPTTLSLYLLPRFVFRGADAGAVRFGVNIVLATVLASGLAMAAGVALFGDPLVSTLFGAGYGPAAALLPWLAVAYLPWALAQGLLISHTARASSRAVVVLVVAAVVQWVAATVLLPDLRAMIVAVGVIGVLTAVALFVLDRADAARELRRG